MQNWFKKLREKCMWCKIFLKTLCKKIGSKWIRMSDKLNWKIKGIKEK